MKRPLVILVLLGILIGTAVVLAEPTAFTISRWTVDGGGGRSSNSQFALTGSAGQFDAHTAATGGDYKVGGGFWQPGVTEKVYEIYLPLIQGGNTTE